jgi:competence ComEA-like helix-hairpin-helix protein
MQANYSQAVSLGQNHGYRFEGDRAFLNAELALGARALAPNRDWALQLWACDAPHQGGPLRGIKVAEAALPRDAEPRQLEAAAKLPPVQREYAMVLVLASGAAGAYDQVHDFSNYPARQSFVGPHLIGSVGYRFEPDALVLQAECVRNPRPASNLSGTLALELWALEAPYEAGEPAGVRLGQAELGQLAGQSDRAPLEARVPRRDPAAGSWQLALLLREWSEAGYQTRDFCNFASPYRTAPTPAPEPRAEAPTRPSVEIKPIIQTSGEAASAQTSAAEARTSIQTASVHELARVDGLNTKLAQAIVRARPFGSLDDLKRVRGIGSKMLQKLRHQLTL